MKAGDWVYLGYVERAHGLRGRIVARLLLAGAAGPLEIGTVLRLGTTEHRVTGSAVRDSQRVMLHLEDVRTREQADGLRGGSLYMRREDVRPAGGLLPLHAFVGMEVRSKGFSGEVTDVEYSDSNPLLMVQGRTGPFPVPLALVMHGMVDWEGGVLETDLPEGLEEMTVDR